MRAGISNTEVRDLDHEELMARLNALLAAYDSPEGGAELQADKIARLSRTIDEMPEIYRWLISLHSWLDHWTDAMADQYGRNANEYKKHRQRRDLLEKMASVAKMRYESASRTITRLTAFDESGMPRSRNG